MVQWRRGLGGRIRASGDGAGGGMAMGGLAKGFERAILVHAEKFLWEYHEDT